MNDDVQNKVTYAVTKVDYTIMDIPVCSTLCYMSVKGITTFCF